MSEVCSKCNTDLAEFVDEPCLECAYQHDPNEPNYNKELDFNEEPSDSYISPVYELEEFADVYDKAHNIHDEV